MHGASARVGQKQLAFAMPGRRRQQFVRRGMLCGIRKSFETRANGCHQSNQKRAFSERTSGNRLPESIAIAESISEEVVVVHSDRLRHRDRGFWRRKCGGVCRRNLRDRALQSSQRTVETAASRLPVELTNIFLATKDDRHGIEP